MPGAVLSSDPDFQDTVTDPEKGPAAGANPRNANVVGRTVIHTVGCIAAILDIFDGSTAAGLRSPAPFTFCLITHCCVIIGSGNNCA